MEDEGDHTTWTNKHGYDNGNYSGKASPAVIPIKASTISQTAESKTEQFNIKWRRNSRDASSNVNNGATQKSYEKPRGSAVESQNSQDVSKDYGQSKEKGVSQQESHSAIKNTINTSQLNKVFQASIDSVEAFEESSCSVTAFGNSKVSIDFFENSTDSIANDSNDKYARAPLNARGDNVSSSTNDNQMFTGINRYDSYSRVSVDSLRSDGIDEDDKSDKEEKAFSLRKLTKDQAIILAATSFTNLLSFLSLSILAPFFPIEATTKNVNSTISGWIFGVFALVQFASSPLFGKLMPVTGTRFMFLAGLFVTAGSTLLFGCLDRINTEDSIVIFVVFCFLTRIMLALGCTALCNAGFVILFKAFPDNVGTVVGIGEVFTGIGMVAGPALGGFLYAAGGFLLPFVIIGGCCFLSLPLLWIFLPLQDDSTESQEEDISLREVLFHPRSLVNSIVIFVGALVWSILDPTLEPHLEVYNFGPEMVGVLFLIMAAFYSITSPIWGMISDRMPDNRTLLIPGLILGGVGLLLSGPSPILGFALSYNQLWLSILSLVLLGVSCSMCCIPTYDIYIDILSDLGYPENTNTYGIISSIWTSMYALGDFAGPIIGGFGDDQIGFEWLMTWVGCLCFVTAILVCVSWFVEKKCCQKSLQNRNAKVSNDITEKTPLLTSFSEYDVMRTYPPGSAGNTTPF